MGRSGCEQECRKWGGVSEGCRKWGGVSRGVGSGEVWV